MSNTRILSGTNEVTDHAQALKFNATNFQLSESQGEVSVEIADNAVDTSEIADGAVTYDKLDESIQFSHLVKFAGKFTTAGGDADESISVSGVIATDIVLVSLQDKGATPRTILTAKAATDAINLVFSGDPSTDHIVCYLVLRGD